MRRHVNCLPSIRVERLDAVFWLDRMYISNVAFACFVPHNILALQLQLGQTMSGTMSTSKVA